MKRIVSVLFCIAVFLGGTTSVQAQIQFGVKGGLNLANAPSTDMEKNSTNVENATGFFIGPMVDLTVPIIGIGVDVAAMYSQKGNKFNDETILQKGIEVPVNLKYSLGFGSLASVFVAAGPSAFFNFNSGSKNIPNNFVAESASSIPSIGNYKPFELSFNIGAGIKAFRHLQIGINYNIPVTNSAVIEAFGVTSSLKTKVWQVSMAYMF